MRRLAVVGTVLLVIGFVAGRLWQQAPVGAEAQGGRAPSSNGDVNGDEVLDIADAVYIIDYQLRGGPPPLPIVCPPTGFPATGQTNCYDDRGSVIDCASTDFPGQDGFYQTGCPNQGRFVDNHDGTVTDNCTGLMWQKETADVNGNGKLDTEWPPDRVQWQDALKYCESLSFAGHDDWRLPNIRELHSIVDYALWEPAMDPVFQAVLSDYWSSSSWILSAGYAWVLILHGGGLSYSVNDKVHFYYVRAVRTVQPGE